MAVITRSNHPDALWPGVKLWFGKEYKKFPRIWSEFFDKDTSDKAWEYLIEATGFGLAPVKMEGASIAYDSDQQGYKNTATHVVYGLGYIVTREELEDDLYREVSETRASSLAFSMSTTAEIVHANYLNRGFSTTTVGDGVALFSTAHPTLSGNQANTLSAAADTTGNKNSIQAIGSTLSYLQRYTLCAALGLAAEEDDDGQSSSGDEPISAEQLAAIQKKADETGADIPRLCKYFKIDALPDIRKSEYANVIAAIDAAAKKKATK